MIINPEPLEKTCPPAYAIICDIAEAHEQNYRRGQKYNGKYWLNGKVVTDIGVLVYDFRPKAGRNSPCPCESGKKFKKCCGRVV